MEETGTQVRSVHGAKETAYPAESFGVLFTADQKERTERNLARAKRELDELISRTNLVSAEFQDRIKQIQAYINITQDALDHPTERHYKLEAIEALQLLIDTARESVDNRIIELERIFEQLKQETLPQPVTPAIHGLLRYSAILMTSLRGRRKEQTTTEQFLDLYHTAIAPLQDTLDKLRTALESMKPPQPTQPKQERAEAMAQAVEWGSIDALKQAVLNEHPQKEMALNILRRMAAKPGREELRRWLESKSS